MTEEWPEMSEPSMIPHQAPSPTLPGVTEATSSDSVKTAFPITPVQSSHHQHADQTTADLLLFDKETTNEPS